MLLRCNEAAKLTQCCRLDVVLKTPQSWKEKDFLVQLQPQQLEAVVEYILEDAESCFGKKRKYEATGAFAKKAKNA